MSPRPGLDGRNISPPTGTRSPDRPARSSAAVSTELPGPPVVCTVRNYMSRDIFVVRISELYVTRWY